MGLDINFYKKDLVEIDSNFGTRDRELFNFITSIGVEYGDEEYGKPIRLTKRQINKIIKYMAKHNEYGGYNTLIAEMTSLKEENKDIYMEADW